MVLLSEYESELQGQRESRNSATCVQPQPYFDAFLVLFVCTGRPCDDGRAASLTVGPIAIMVFAWLLIIDHRGIYLLACALQPAIL